MMSSRRESVGNRQSAVGGNQSAVGSQQLKLPTACCLLLTFCIAYCLLISLAFAAGTWLAFTNFTAGELSPLMDGRIDMAKYQSGCSTLQNFLVYPHGPITKRPGFQYIAETKTSANPARLIPFEFSTEQAYVLELGQQYMRFYTDGGQVLWMSGGTPYEIATPYAATDLDKVKWCQSGDIMYLVHPSYDVYQLARSGHTNWAIDSISGASAFTADPFTAVDNYPSCCTFHENRLVFGNTNTDPTTIWMSKSGDFDNFTTGALDDDAIIITLASDQVNEIQWLVPAIYMTLGTTAGEWRISAVDPDDPITPTNITAKREVVHGSDDLLPVQIGKDIIFIQRGKHKLRKLAYNWESAGYLAPDITILSEHITGSGVSAIAYQPEPWAVMWGVRKDGDLIGLTYQPEHEVYAWHHHVTQGQIESIAVIPEGDDYTLYAIINREINGGTSRFVEALAAPWSTAELKDCVFLDSSISYAGSGASVFSGAAHLMNTPVYALVDGQVVSGITVDATGGVSTGMLGSTVHIGLPYTSVLQTVRVEAPTEEGGTSQGRIKRLSKAIVRLYRSHNMSIGPNLQTLLPVQTGAGVTTVYTGDIEVELPGGYDTEGKVTVTQPNPLPLTIRSMMIKATTGD